ncbi:excalibur calcium-binding domain-containing protein [Pseudomonas citronellolis]|uniref:excalibur calcium-binding domain-containing protein n=1 Tax=Pseudomonas citronellolis TaxID=53408 RepID=UPI0023E36D78|nr:excalibur calcium-binding domain-containing protein [Pseudomonas citronellolis]MDF3933378.1 excalibur calcium-binding domain-containing protein [Pseudomonas citronellolis]
MKKWIFLGALALLAWQYMDNPSWQERFSRPKPAPMSLAEEPAEPDEPTTNLIPPAASSPTTSSPPASATLSVRCDGRQHCSQMTSCAEAKAFLRSCPGMKMDGDHDGIPCEDQLCRM